jgi:hypothetical protein
VLGTELSPEESADLIAYGRQKFAAEHYPLSPALRPVRDALAKLDPKPEPALFPPAKPHVPSRSTTEEAAVSASNPHLDLLRY